MAVFLMHKQLGAVYRYALMVLLVSVVDKAERVGIRAVEQQLVPVGQTQIGFVQPHKIGGGDSYARAHG